MNCGVTAVSPPERYASPCEGVFILFLSCRGGGREAGGWLSNLQRSISEHEYTIPEYTNLQVDLAARFKELLRDGRITVRGSVVERRPPFLGLKIDVTARCNQMHRHVSMPWLFSTNNLSHDVERSSAMLSREINVTVSCNEQLCHGAMTAICREVEGRVPIRILNVNLTAPCNEVFCN